MLDLKKEKRRIFELQAERNVSINDFPYGAKVQFLFNEEQLLEGTIEIRDYHGGGIYYGVCSSVDILGNDGVLYKHVPIVDVELVGGE